MYRFCIILILLLSNISLFSQRPESELYVEGLSKLWSEVNYNFVYPERLDKIKWDSIYVSYIPKVMESNSLTSYYNTLKSFLAHLDNSHTDIWLCPKDLNNNDQDYYQLNIQYIDEKLVVVDMPQSLSFIKRGSIITQIEDTPSLTYLKNNFFDQVCASTFESKIFQTLQYLSLGKYNSKVKITLIPPHENSEQEVFLKRNTRHGKKKNKWVYGTEINNSFKVLPNNIAYLKLQSFRDEENGKIFNLFHNNKKDIELAKCLIIDLRDNIGGSDATWIELAKYFCYGDTIRYCKLRSRINSSFYKAKGAFADSTVTRLLETKTHPSPYFNYYRNNAFEDYPVEFYNDIDDSEKISLPIYVIINGKTASAGEGFALVMKNMKRATLVGESSMGSLGQPLLITLPFGGLARICSVRTFTYDTMSDISEQGITPDIFVKRTVNDIIENRDIVLQEILKICDSDVH